MYDRMAGAADTHGPMYEVKMAALLFLRAKNQGVPFKLFSNVANAGKFDDIVFKYMKDGHWRTCFLQMKHKTSTSKISWQALNAPRGDFSLQGLYESFCEIKKNMNATSDGIFMGEIENCSFVLFSKAQHELPDTDVENRCGEDVFYNFLKFETRTAKTVGLKKGTFCPAEKNNDQKEEEWHDDFLNQFLVCSGMPREEQLDEYIISEIMKAGHVIDFDDIKEKFVTNIKPWSLNKEKNSIVLNEGSDAFETSVKKARAQGSLERRCIELYLDVEFEESCLVDLKKSIQTMHGFLHILHSQTNPKIIYNKLLQVFKGDGRLYNFLSLSDPQRSDRLAAWNDTKNRVLVLVADGEQCGEGKCEDHTPFLDEIHNILTENSDKRVVFISCEKCVYFPGVWSEQGSKYQRINETFVLEQITNDSLADLLKGEVNFQGMDILKEDFGFIKNSENIKPELASFILEKATYKFGKGLMEPPSYYIDRTLQRQNYIKKTINKCDLKDKYVITGVTQKDLRGLGPSKPTTQGDEEGSFVVLDSGREELHFDDLCQQHKNVHWLHENESGLFWKRTHGSIHEVLEHLEDNIQSTYSPADILVNKERCVVLLAEPGMGKSTLMTSLALETKKTWPMQWVVYVELKDYYEELENENFNPDDVFHRMATNDYTSLIEKALLAYTLNKTDRVHVFIDGYDELSEHCIENCRTLLQYLLVKKIKKLWVSTRYCRKQDLEIYLNIKSYSLTSFSETNQIIFFSKYWNDVVKESDIKKIITLLNSCLNEKEKEFTGIPLQCLMIGEIYKDDPEQKIKTISGKLDIAIMYEEFIQKKYRIFYEEKIGISVQKSPRLFKKFCDATTREHTAASMILLLDESSLNSLSYQDVKKVFEEFAKAVETGEENIGIVDRIIKDKPNFVHRTYAEYYFGKWLADNFRYNRIFIEKHLYEPEFDVVRSFFNRSLCQECDLHTAVLDGNHEQLVEALQSCVDVIKVDKGGRTALHLTSAVRHDQTWGEEQVKMVDALVEHGARVVVRDEVLEWTPHAYADHLKAYYVVDSLLAKELELVDTRGNNDKLNDLAGLTGVSCNDIKIYMTTPDDWKRTPLHRAAEHGKEDVVDFLVKNISEDKNKVTQYVNQRASWGSFSAMHLGAERGYLGVVRLLAIAGGDMRALDSSNRTPLHKAAVNNREDVVDFLANNISEDEGDVTRYVNQRDEWGLTSMHLGSESGSLVVVKLLARAGGDMRALDSNNRTPLHRAAWCNSEDVVDFLVNNISEDKNEVTQYVNQGDGWGSSAMHLGSISGTQGVVRLLAKAGGDMSAKDNRMRTPLHRASEHNSEDVVNFLVNNISEDRNEVTQYVNQVNDEGFTAVCFAKRNKNMFLASQLENVGGVPCNHSH